VGVQEAKHIMMEHFARTARKFGLSELYGYIYGLLFFEEEPMSLGEIVERVDTPFPTSAAPSSSLRALGS